jgi:hypothetical protein
MMAQDLKLVRLRQLITENLRIQQGGGQTPGGMKELAAFQA